MQRTEIPLGKAKVFVVLLIGITFLALGWWLFQLDNVEIAAHSRHDSPLFVHGMGVASMLLGGLGCFAAVRKLVDRAPGLVLDARGLTDNFSAVAAGFVPWADITGYEIRQVQRQRVLYILLDAPERHIARMPPIRRVLLRANMRFAPSPVGIASSGLAIGFDELVVLVAGYLVASRQADRVAPRVG